MRLETAPFKAKAEIERGEIDDVNSSRISVLSFQHPDRINLEQPASLS